MLTFSEFVNFAENYNKKSVESFTKTSLAKFAVWFFKQPTGTIPGDVPH